MRLLNGLVAVAVLGLLPIGCSHSTVQKDSSARNLASQASGDSADQYLDLIPEDGVGYKIKVENVELSAASAQVFCRHQHVIKGALARSLPLETDGTDLHRGDAVRFEVKKLADGEYLIFSKENPKRPSRALRPLWKCHTRFKFAALDRETGRRFSSAPARWTDAPIATTVLDTDPDDIQDILGSMTLIRLKDDLYFENQQGVLYYSPEDQPTFVSRDLF